jgi:hypothetical protein
MSLLTFAKSKNLREYLETRWNSELKARVNARGLRDVVSNFSYGLKVHNESGRLAGWPFAAKVVYHFAIIVLTLAIIIALVFIFAAII